MACSVFAYREVLSTRGPVSAAERAVYATVLRRLRRQPPPAPDPPP